LNKKYEPYLHFVKELDEFTVLLEQDRKSDYKALMEDFGQKMIDSNLRAIETIAKQPAKQPVKQPVKEDPTDFAALLRKKKEKEKGTEDLTDFAALLRKKKEKEDPTDFASLLAKKKLKDAQKV